MLKTNVQISVLFIDDYRLYCQVKIDIEEKGRNEQNLSIRLTQDLLN